jgi:Ca2+-binding EF-hand superfamily protein
MTKTLLSAGIALIAFAGQAIAHISPVLVRDGITRQQAMQRADRLFDLLDVNHDGLLTRSEAERAGAQMRAQRASSGTDVAPGIGGHTARYLEHRFAGARSITREQFERGMLAHFDQMDLNRDGVLTADEREQTAASRSQGN